MKQGSRFLREKSGRSEQSSSGRRSREDFMVKPEFDLGPGIAFEVLERKKEGSSFKK